MSFVALGLTVYLSYRQQIFEFLAVGAKWVLVTSGFVAEGQGSAGDDVVMGSDVCQGTPDTLAGNPRKNANAGIRFSDQAIDIFLSGRTFVGD